MTQRASDLLAEASDRLSADAGKSALVAAEAVTAIEPDLLKGFRDGSTDDMGAMSTSFLQALFQSLRPSPPPPPGRCPSPAPRPRGPRGPIPTRRRGGPPAVTPRRGCRSSRC